MIKNVLVFYINVNGLSEKNAKKLIKKSKKRMKSKDWKNIFIPIQHGDSRVEHIVMSIEK